MDLALSDQHTASELTPRSHSHKMFQLKIVQQPVEGRSQNGGSRKNPRSPIDPPPVLELTTSERDPEKWMYIHNPNWFCTAALETVELDKSRTAGSETHKDNMSGQLVSSLHKVKSPEDKREHGYFAFGDLIVRDHGSYRLKFTLFEICRDPSSGDTYASEVHSAASKIFRVHSGRGSTHTQASSELSKALAEAGVKLRIKKEATRRRTHNTDWSSTPRDNLGASAIQLAPMIQMPPPASNSRSARNQGIDVSGRITTKDDPLTPVTDSRLQTTPPQLQQFPLLQRQQQPQQPQPQPQPQTQPQQHLQPQQQPGQAQMMTARGGQHMWTNNMMSYTSSPTAMTNEHAFPTVTTPYQFQQQPPPENMWTDRNAAGFYGQSPESVTVPRSDSNRGLERPPQKRSRDSGYGQSAPSQSFLSQMSASQPGNEHDYHNYTVTSTLPLHTIPAQMGQFSPHEVIPAGEGFGPFGRQTDMVPHVFTTIAPDYHGYSFAAPYPGAPQGFYSGPEQ